MNLKIKKLFAQLGIREAGETITEGRPSVSDDFDIEESLLELMNYSGNVRVLRAILAWLRRHANYLVVEKMIRYTKYRIEKNEKCVRWLPFYAAYAYYCGHHKFKKLISPRDQRLVYLDEGSPEATEVNIEKSGLEPWLDGVDESFRVPMGACATKKGDMTFLVESATKFGRRNRQFQNRHLYGVCWRSDIITAIESGSRTATAVVTKLNCSYAPALRILREYRAFMQMESPKECVKKGSSGNRRAT